MKYLTLIIFGFLIAFSSQSQKLTIAVSANAQYALRDLVKEFKKENKVEIDLISGSSGKLATQIIQGAPFHIFFSADMEYPEELYKKGLAIEQPQIYAYGILVLWTLRDLKLESNLEILKSESIKGIAIANPKVAPYGKQALNVLKHYNLYDIGKEKLIYGESIAQVNHYINSKSCDIGFTSKSSVLSPEVKNKGKWIEINKDAYEPIKQGVVILKQGSSEHNDFCQKFLTFTLSKRGKQILEKNGYKFE